MELQTELSAGVVALEISHRNARVHELQEEWNRLRKAISDRAAHYRAGGDDDYGKAVPDGDTGLLCKTWVGKESGRPVYKVDIGTLAELRATVRQAAEELEQWKIRSVAEVKVTFSPAAEAMAKVLTYEQL